VTEPLQSFCREPRQAPDSDWLGLDFRSLPALKLISRLHALRRDLNKRDQRISQLEQSLIGRGARIADLTDQIEARDRQVVAHKEEIERLRDEIERLQGTLEEIRQGRVMRFLDGINHILKGDPLA
jgi:septal ring factor EnvC (AmiA/AmiB activator)